MARRLSDGKICVVLHQNAAAMDVIKSVLHSVRYHHELKSLLQQQSLSSATGGIHIEPAQERACLQSSHEWTQSNFATFVSELDDKDWQSDAVFWGDSGYRVTWRRLSQGNKDGGDDATMEKIVNASVNTIDTAL